MSFPIVMSALAAISPFQQESVCADDDRVPEQTPAVGYAQGLGQEGHHRFCTLTLIDDACALTAGHCLEVLQEAVFFDGSEAGSAPGAQDAHKYRVDQSFVHAIQSRIGNDWAVVRLQPNLKTGLLPGKVHGFIDPVIDAADYPTGDLELRSVNRNSDGALVRLKSPGQVLWMDGSILFHDLDTSPGSSGALVTDALGSKAYAIHTHGGCNTMKNNKATIIARVPNLVRSIQACRLHPR